MESLSASKEQSWLVWFIRGFLVFAFLILIGRLFDLQIIRGDYFRSLSDGNRIRRIAILAPRGKIFARGGETLVDNEEIKKSVIFNENVGFEKIPAAGNSKSEGIITEWKRIYTLSEAASHITGYVGEVNEEELGKIRGGCPDHGPRKLGNFVGRTGLEEEYECLLFGTDGEELIEVDAMGKNIRSLGRRDPIPGNDLKTTIDFGLQNKVYDLMKDKKGGVVISDGNGQILALYSAPGYDPNVFVDIDKRGEIASIVNNKDFPLFNRVIGGLFHPGSIYKPFVAAAALSDGKIDKNYYYNDTGSIVIKSVYGTYEYKNWYFTQYGGVEGNINLVKALARSTDTFFYKVGELTGVDEIVKWSEKFGLNQDTEIDLPGEMKGLVPNQKWKLKVKGERWFLGNTYHMSIGQGDLALTPIALNMATSAIVNGGKLCKAHIGEKDIECRDIGLNADSISLIKEGMADVCKTGGTGYTFFDFKEKSGVDVLCKTGTAQNESGEPHAWFSAIGPSENPQIVATILVENGGEGSKVAGPIAREIFNYYFKVPLSPSLTPTPKSQ